MASDHLWQRGGQWYLRLAIPRPLRQHFLSSTGKPLVRIVEPLGDSKSQAQIEAARRSAKYLETFARLKAGETLEEVQQSDRHLEINKQILRRALGTDETARSLDIRRILAETLDPDTARTLAETLLQGIALAPAAPADSRRALDDAPFKSLDNSETVSQAAEALYGALDRDERRQTTIDGHKLRVRAFVEACGDVPVASITRAVASDWLDKIGEGRSNRTRNSYAMSLALVVETARRRGRFQGENPFAGQKVKAVGESYQPFTEGELHKLFAALPREIKPAQHSPETALPWVALIAAYTGARLEEIAQLSAADIREQQANGATVWVLDVHNGGKNLLKNAASARLIPIHSELVRAGLLRYVAALPKGSALFPGLVRRASKGGKIGARLGELFRRKLIALNLKRAGVCFHSFRHTVSGKLDQAGVAQTDAARVLGHDIPGMTFGTYSQGPGLKRLAAVVEEIHYDNI
jgi:integrase